MGDDGRIIYTDGRGKIRSYDPNEFLVKRKAKIRFNNQFKKFNCKDITSDFMKKATPGIGKIDKSDYVVVKGKRYNANGKNIKAKPTAKEKENAKWWIKTIGGNMYYQPRVKPPPEGVKTADYYCDYIKGTLEHKGPTGNSANTISHQVRKAEGQSRNILIDISNSAMLFKTGMLDVIEVFNHEDYAWVDLIILRKGNQFIVLKRI